MTSQHTPEGSDRLRRPRRRLLRRARESDGATARTPRPVAESAQIVDPTGFLAELQTAIDERADDDRAVTVASISVYGLDRVRDRHGALFAFDLVTELVAVVHRHLSGDDVYNVAEDGDVTLLCRRTPDATRAVAAEICRSIASHRWDDGTDEIRLPASAGVAVVDAVTTPDDVIQSALAAAAGARGRRADADVPTARSIWSAGGATDLFGADRDAPRRVRGPVAAERRAEPPTSRPSDASRADVFTLAEYRPPAESARLTAAMVLPPQGSALGVPLLAASRRSDQPKRPDPSPAVDENAEPASSTHTRAMLDAIQASLVTHAAEALDAIEASLPGFEPDVHADDPDEGSDATAADDEPDQAFSLPVRQRPGDRPDPG